MNIKKKKKRGNSAASERPPETLDSVFLHSVPGNSCVLSAAGRYQYGTEIKESLELLEQKDCALELTKHTRQRTEMEKNKQTPNKQNPYKQTKKLKKKTKKLKKKKSRHLAPVRADTKCCA